MARGRRAGPAVSLFVDTSAWYPLAITSHPDHRAVASALEERVGLGERIVTTNLVVAETQALLLRRAGREAALRFAKTVRLPPNTVVFSTAATEEAGLTDWIERYQDQDFSLTDAVSFAVMAEMGIETALTLDRHFATAGFLMVPGQTG